MQVEFSGACRVTGALALLLLGACSGGGDDGETARQLQVSSTSLTFAADSPIASAPAAQIITATFSEGVTNIAALHTGPAIEDVQVTLNGSSAQITITPAAPSAIGAGVFKGTIALTAYFCGDPTCTRLEAGASSTINASYQVSPLITQVAPSVAIAGTSSTAVVRGIGFRGFAIQGVNFGTTPATSFTLTDTVDTQLVATYPALAAGTYSVALDVPTHAGAVPSSATLTVVDPVTRAAEALAWPAAPTMIYALEYDNRNGALLVATDANGGQLVRYPYAAGAWQPPLTAAFADVRDAALSIDGSKLLTISTTALTPVDPVTLAFGTAALPPSPPANSFLKSIALLNTNVALITTGVATSTATEMYSYTVSDGQLAKLPSTFDNGTARGSANGSTIAVVQGNPSLASPLFFYIANATSGQISSANIALNQNAIPPAFDRDATRLVLNGTRVYDSALALLGTLPDTTAGVALSPDGKRAYTYDTAVNALRVFDISATKSGEAYTPVGDPVALIAAPGSNIKMTISADANTLFIAGTSQVIVQPTPAL